MSQHSIGVEEEHQLLDPSSGALSSLPSEIFAKGSVTTESGTLLKRELHTCAVEIDSGICDSVSDLEQSLQAGRRGLFNWCATQDLAFAAAGSHPWGHWENIGITDAARYQGLLEELQDVGRSNLIYGLHVHVAIDSPAQALQIMNAARVFLPHLLALSCSSPFWGGRDSGLMSMRSSVFARMPRTGIPPAFKNTEEYQNITNTLIKTNCIDEPTKIWWDMRPHAIFPTLEFRVCDIPTRLEDSVTIAALAQAIVVKMKYMLQRGENLQTSHRGFVAENKWRAARYGLTGKLVDFSNQQEQDAKTWIAALLDFVDEVVDDLDSRKYVERVWNILQRGNSAQRQRKIAEGHRGDLKAVVEDLVEQSMWGIDEERA